MKKPDKSRKFRFYVKRKEERFKKRRLFIKIKNKIKRRLLQGKNKFQIKEINKLKFYTHILAPKNLLFLKNTQEVIRFIDQLEYNFKKRSAVFVNLKKVENIDYSSITVLLSVMIMFKIAKINFNGNFPINSEIRAKLIDSQFFHRLEKPIASENEYLIKKKNQIFTKGDKMVVSDLGLNVIQEASETIWGEKRVCKGVQRVLIELMQNTHNHASSHAEGKEFWWLSINHNSSQKKVSFEEFWGQVLN